MTYADIQNINRMANTFGDFTAQPGNGLYLLAIGGGIALLAGLTTPGPSPRRMTTSPPLTALVKMLSRPTPDFIRASRTATPKRSVGNAFAALTLLGGSLLLAGTLMPWYLVESPDYSRSVSVLFSGGDGVIILGCAVATLCIALARLCTSTHAVVQRLPVALGGLVGLVTSVDLSITNVGQVGPPALSMTMDYGPGLYLTIAGAAVTVMGGLAVARPAPTSPDEAPTGWRRSWLPATSAAVAAVSIGIYLSGLLYSGSILAGLLAIVAGAEAIADPIQRRNASRTLLALTITGALLGAAVIVISVHALVSAKLA